MCALISSIKLSSETFFILCRTERCVMKNFCIGLNVKRQLFLSEFNGNWIFLGRFLERKKNPEILNFVKIRPFVADLFHSDGQAILRTPVKDAPCIESVAPHLIAS
jgi:hypothetical protein